MTLSAQLWSENADVAADVLGHPFVRGVGDGSLPRAIFAGYLAQDAFFLESFARAYALALVRSPDTSTLLTLLLVPTLYTMVELRKERRAKRKALKRAGGTGEAGGDETERDQVLAKV